MIGRLFFWLFHVHKWETINEVPLHLHGESGKVYSTGKRFYQRCTVCGKVVKRDLA